MGSVVSGYHAGVGSSLVQLVEGFSSMEPAEWTAPLAKKIPLLITPPKINMEPGNGGETNRNLLFQGAPIFRFHVCFGGCICFGM